MALPSELENLPPPSLIEELDFETARLRFMSWLQQEFDAAGIPFEVGDLNANPAAVLIRVATYIDGNLRVRINEAIQSWFLAYAASGDLDVLAQWYDVARLAGETDDALRRRIVENIRGRSTGGTEARYRAIALNTDSRVADVAVYTVGRDPTVHVAVFSTDNSGVADAALLAKVGAALQAPTVRMVNDTIVVAAAAQQAIAVTANVWLLPQAPESVLADMVTNLRAAWSRDMLLGRDLSRSWLMAKLQVDGVQRVELVAPTSDISIPFNRAAALGAVTLAKMGRNY
ncbi:MAG TPA: baseplate J/gp47 family protein [Devosia sp.]|jgi:phage-related baseplate assembly protein|nr:baseplate J/gp47 family protein [Devosia sp.]